MNLPEAQLDATETNRINLLKDAKARGIYYDCLDSARIYDSEDEEEEDCNSEDDGPTSDDETIDDQHEQHIANEQAPMVLQGGKTKRGPTDMKKF